MENWTPTSPGLSAAACKADDVQKEFETGNITIKFARVNIEINWSALEAFWHGTAKI